MTGSNNDPEEWKKIIGTKAHKEELARKFKDNNDPMKIAIVVDMWLTGFDVPSLATMYIYKPMHGYNLMQAIARVNRVFKDKEGGLIVDYVGIASALKAAMKEYTKRDQSKYGDMNITRMAYPKFQEKLQVCKDILHGFDFSGFIGGSPLMMAQLITGGANFILDARVPERKDMFLKEAMLLKQSHSLCSSMTTEQERHEAAYMEAVRSTVIKITYGGTAGKNLSLKEINDQINELLKAAVQSEGVINLFDSSKTGGEQFSLFDPAVLDEISKMKEKNIAVEILKKLMAEQVSLYKRTNVVQSQKFSEKIAQLMNSYYNGLITNEEVIKELLKTAQEIAELYKNGEKLGLSQEELAFYDAITKPEHIKDFYKNDELIALTKELTEMLRKNRTIDWQKKETARAQMRKMVKRLLKKYKYPPEDYDYAINTVISQCELWTDNVEPRKEEKLYQFMPERELSKVAEEKHHTVLIKHLIFYQGGLPMSQPIQSEAHLTTFEAISMIVGNSIGTGIIAVPYLATKNSMLDVVWMVLIAYCVNVILHLIIAELSYNNGGVQLVKSFEGELFHGKMKQIFSWGVFIVYGLAIMIGVSGNINGGAQIFVNWFGMPFVAAQILYYVIAGVVVFIGMKAVGIAQKYAVIVLMGIVAVMTVGTFLHPLNTLQRTEFHWNNLLALYSMVVFATSANQAVIQVVKGLDGNAKQIRRSIFIGFGLSSVFVLIVTGTVLLGTKGALEKELAYMQLGESIGTWAMILAGVFSLFALLTTFWSNTLALRDVVHEQIGSGNRISWLIATVPCILFAVFGVNSFIVLTRIMSGVVVLVSIMLVLTYGNPEKRRAAVLSAV